MSYWRSKLNRWKGHIPEGVQDYMPEECFNKRKIEESIRKVFFLSGYDEIETPIFEYFDVFTGDKASIEQEKMMKIVEAGSRILVIRPDITMPIARIAATKLKEELLPLRLSYLSSIYRYEELQMGKQREVAQAGIELMGVKGPEADAEVISTAIECFLNLGLKEFQIDVGQVEFFKGLIEDAGLNAENREKLRLLIDQKNMLGLELFLQEIPMNNALKDIFLQLPQMYGNVGVLEKAALYTKNSRCQKAIENIREIHKTLKAFELDRFITFDLGMVHSLNYYTGIIFKGFTQNLGFPICGGGRYDKLLSEFGYDIPATGFAIGIKRLLIALERQSSLNDIPNIDVLVVFDEVTRKEGYGLIKRLREEGKRVEIFLGAGNSNDPQSYAKAKGISKVITINKNSEEVLL